MRVVVAMMSHETNTFSPVPTPLESFGPGGPYFGAAAAAAYRGTNTPMAAYLDIFEGAGAEIATPVAADAHPSAPVAAAAYQCMTDAICEAVDEGCDALCLDLHGAMVAETTDDGEGTLLARLRAAHPELPIAVAFDLHANLTRQIVDNCTVLAGYKTYPHVDSYETGRRAGTILLGALRGEVRPVMAWGPQPMLAHTLRMASAESPMRELIARADAAVAGGLLDVSVFGGFPLADIPRPGLSVLAVADGDGAAAAAAAKEILDLAWAARADFVYRPEPLARSIARAKELSEGPILLVDHADNCASGGTQDTMAVLAEALDQGLEDMAVFAIRDAAAVARLIEAGIGASVTLPFGGKIDMPAIGRRGAPLTVTGVVRQITDGEFTITGPMGTGTRAYLGRAVVLDTGGVEIVVIENNHEPYDLGCFRSLGIEPTEKRYLLLKSRIHYRAGFAPIARHIVECDGVGVTSSDYGLFDFRKLVRPAYPLDPEAAPAPGPLLQRGAS
ncbi:MAG: M81 family metallopeptidase [Proteobacteria bacterium]|nr:M81 family metallopeptidase [Pseudomonadota bacterium]